MTLAKGKRVRKRRDFLRVQRYGFRVFGRFIVAISEREKEKTLGRFGITVPKKVGPAHIRNKVKRRIRHVMRHNQTLFFERTIVIVARDSISNANFSDLENDLIETCKRLKYHRNSSHAPKRDHSKFSAQGALHERSI